MQLNDPQTDRRGSGQAGMMLRPLSLHAASSCHLTVISPLSPASLRLIHLQLPLNSSSSDIDLVHLDVTVTLTHRRVTTKRSFNYWFSFVREPIVKRLRRVSGARARERTLTPPSKAASDSPGLGGWCRRAWCRARGLLSRLSLRCSEVGSSVAPFVLINIATWCNAPARFGEATYQVNVLTSEKVSSIRPTTRYYEKLALTHGGLSGPLWLELKRSEQQLAHGQEPRWCSRRAGT